MKAKDFMNIASVAAGTAAVTIVTCWPGSTDAGAEQDALAAKIAKPKLVCNGVEMSLAAAGGRVFKAGDLPVFELAAVNTTAEPATVAVGVVMSASSTADALSRVIRLPAILCQEQRLIVLKPHEARTVLLSPKTKLPPNSLISVSLEESPGTETGKASVANSTVLPLQQPERGLPSPQHQPSVVALTFSTITGPANATLASSR